MCESETRENFKARVLIKFPLEAVPFLLRKKVHGVIELVTDWLFDNYIVTDKGD